MEEVLKKISRFLKFRPRSKWEVKRKLKALGVKDVESVVSYLESIGVVDDESFAKSWVRGRWKIYGPIRLRSELKQLRVNDSYIDKALAVIPEQEWKEVVRELVNRGYSKERILRRGFPASWIEL